MFIEYDHPWKKLSEEFGPHTKVSPLQIHRRFPSKHICLDVGNKISLIDNYIQYIQNNILMICKFSVGLIIF